MEKVRAAMGGIALVTGASRGLGRVMAEKFASTGYAVAVNYRSSHAEAEALCRQIEDRGGIARSYQADMSSAEEARALVDRVETDLGPLSAVVSNAGITKDRLLVQMSEDDWAATWTTDLVGPRALCASALARMAERRSGRIVTISSVVGMTGNAGQANYAAAKAALHGLTRDLALRGASAGVTVNCVVPGFFATDATAHLTESQRRAWYIQIPMGRAGSPDDIAALTLFLMGPNAGYITGQCIAVDGGFLAGAGRGFQS